MIAGRAVPAVLTAPTRREPAPTPEPDRAERDTSPPEVAAVVTRIAEYVDAGYEWQDMVPRLAAEFGGAFDDG